MEAIKITPRNIKDDPYFIELYEKGGAKVYAVAFTVILPTLKYTIPFKMPTGEIAMILQDWIIGYSEVLEEESKIWKEIFITKKLDRQYNWVIIKMKGK